MATIVLSLGDLIETLLEHFLKDDRAYQGLLFHVFLDKLDQELVDEFLEAAWDLLHVLMLHESNDFPEGRRVDDLVLRLRIESDELAKDRDHELVDGDRECHLSNTSTVQYLEQRDDSLLVSGLGYLLCELLLIR